MKQATGIIVGAGPAGLTAAYELLQRTDIRPVIYEATESIGGICRTVEHNGNRIDIGGHRFFSRSEKVTRWWRNILPAQDAPTGDDPILRGSASISDLSAMPEPEGADKVMLLRKRISRIYYRGKLFDYPISINTDTLSKMGAVEAVRVGLSYLHTRLRPIRSEDSFEDFVINRFGRRLYESFFKDYTQKVWGVPPSALKPEWGAQRIKGLSVYKVLKHGFRTLFRGTDLSGFRLGGEAGTADMFLYPKYGPGQLWEEAAERVVRGGGTIRLNHCVTGVEIEKERVRGLLVRNTQTEEVERVSGDWYFSTMPIKDLISAMGADVPGDVRRTASGLPHRDFITVALLVKELKLTNRVKHQRNGGPIPDQWIYIQDKSVRSGRLQVYNNWSPHLVRDDKYIWLGVEYFCKEEDDLWRMEDHDLAKLASSELIRLGILENRDVMDYSVVRQEKAYPGYFGTYEQFDLVRSYVDRFQNLFTIGRNGMHRYNNMDHSMLAAMTAVDNIVNHIHTKENLWIVNSEARYHEDQD